MVSTKKEDPVVEDTKPVSKAASAESSVSHPSVAAIVTADPGGVSGPDKPTMLVNAKGILGAERKASIPIPAREEVAKPIPPFAKDPNVVPVAEEQLKRSEENDKRGMQNWPHDHDDRRRPSS